MMQRLLVLMAVLVGVLAGGCATVQTETATRYYDYDDELLGGMPVKGLLLAIQKVEGQPYSINVLLKNEEDRRQLVNAHFVVDRGDFNNTPNLFVFLADNDSGEKIVLNEKKGADRGFDEEEARADWFQLLAGKEYFMLTIDLHEYFTIDPERSYRIYCEYSNTASGYREDGQWIEKYAWVGSISSNSLVLSRR